MTSSQPQNIANEKDIILNKICIAMVNENLTDFTDIVNQNYLILDEIGSTIISHAIRFDNDITIGAIKHVLNVKPDIKPAYKNENPLSTSIKLKKYKLSELLISNYAFDVKDKEEKTPLEIAISCRAPQTITDLIIQNNKLKESIAKEKLQPRRSSRTGSSGIGRRKALSKHKIFKPKLSTIEEEKSDPENPEISDMSNTDILKNLELSPPCQSSPRQKLGRSTLEQPNSGQVVDSELPSTASSHPSTESRTAIKLKQSSQKDHGERQGN